jgi:beta-xylosidase
MPSFTWHNPILSKDIPAIRDPQIIPFEGAYYLIGTSPPFWGRENGDGPSPGVKMWRSDDLLNWSFHKMLIDRGDVLPDAWYRDNFWAPEIHLSGGRFYLTFNCQNNTGHRFPHQNVGLAVSDRIDGPYEILTKDKPLWAQANDATLLTDDDGRSYLFVSDIWGAEVDLKNARLISEKKKLIDQERGKWDGMIIEGPVAFKRDGLYYLLYSSNTRGYEVGYATAKSPLGPYTKGKNSPFFGAQSKKICDSRPPDLHCPFDGDPDSPYLGCGHNTVFKGPGNRDWICCHYELDFDEHNPGHTYRDFFPTGNAEGKNKGPYRIELLGMDPFWFDENGDLHSHQPSYKEQTISW